MLNLLNVEAFIQYFIDDIKYVKNANESLKWYFFTEFLFKSYHITVSLLTVMRATNGKDVLFHLSFLSIIVGQAFLIYYHVNELSLESTYLSQRIFNSNWYDQSSEVKRSLLIVMARVQRPLVLTIGNFGVIDNDLIVTMVKAAYSFVLYQII
ncbi:unnamed protein product [Phaedon cochleariae]|uniref:Odorant receptor n=1 Tax=Phaedon cochleariae TaxID=80249 RepID=A0A9P0DTR4_PHACE|nr:unnamed protein product [Phaedon cochleariae]